tara:strand:- start:3071 stop:3586 length:516 start_codon:yes stop_codon:yes gene_type:complete
MKVINLFGGPGCGKSTAAAGLFHLMKSKHMSVELVNEFAKEVVWENNLDALKDQLYLFANQNRKLERLKGKVEYAITDSPLLLTLVYMPKGYPESFREFVEDIYYSYNNINVFINRVKSYVKTGRVETEEQAKAIDERIKKLLIGEDYLLVDGDQFVHWKIYNRLFEENRK